MFFVYAHFAKRKDFYKEFSDIIIPLSTITPIASAIPVRDIILDDNPKAFNMIKLMATVTGI
jgi:hypothetical protein